MTDREFVTGIDGIWKVVSTSFLAKFVTWALCGPMGAGLSVDAQSEPWLVHPTLFKIINYAFRATFFTRTFWFLDAKFLEVVYHVIRVRFWKWAAPDRWGCARGTPTSISTFRTTDSRLNPLIKGEKTRMKHLNFRLSKS